MVWERLGTGSRWLSLSDYLTVTVQSLRWITIQCRARNLKFHRRRCRHRRVHSFHLKKTKCEQGGNPTRISLSILYIPLSCKMITMRCYKIVETWKESRRNKRDTKQTWRSISDRIDYCIESRRLWGTQCVSHNNIFHSGFYLPICENTRYIDCSWI